MATLYAGMEGRITVYGDDFDAVTLVSPDVSMTITIWDIDRVTKLVDEDTMLWDATFVSTRADGTIRTGAWHYLWVTPTVAGAYTARISAHAGGIVPAFNFKTIRARQPKVA